MNSCTILALRDTVTEKDIFVLQKTLSDKDNVIRLTVINTLSTMEDTGINVLKADPASAKDMDATYAIQNAKEATKGIDSYRNNGQCRIRR